ncbi:peptidoglycan DD-metalloendopeptidase family protein [bacterium endosymbiont of Bathymodiolus sp. 5 South]|jgi:murein DD-endopeptidase MepM/ murein hydrolase activator NlpD|uniref:peptidoglycan DD-metalloendopeptidase family protein n=1 Tax=bacterium endosymbiont of Bathymodiolus sp. 5 South TaxID=1181670 RepID=UPI0010B65E67|nr:peptidoglycan DD-metalloendopeptidase family protein [bacterium endosymbiont of Bathymodiolus sp. 5 South]CAC9653534.1 Peptidase, M23/M37 family [uncultured Gammaproteobacteria bacterium]CAC9658635.1 Peptidase, M23/M37 family [uncultured Gammaproteobacteria bacterium]SHN89938.1 Peptidase, M23/M37 family [bacterium endosymbiont of Bathymodiolus sp. 5 South]SSC07998.1 Peptidase, M23/M37 family [bacterium endosymbiont of Bathymodiolus sp. 5 South]VVH57391.1 Peptidase, M23/M37 family [unculture
MRKFTLLLLFSLFFISGTNALERSTIHITRSLAYDAQRVGISQKTINNMVRIFSWKIDFDRDLERGDRFIVFGKRHATPSALIYVGKKKRVAVFSYTDKYGRLGYYGINGKTLYPSFLKAPLKYKRISSKFHLKRFHPILKTWRSHRAVDYAAEYGTPVYAVADGVIKHRKRMGALGKSVHITHGSNYLTVYAHLSRFSRGLRTSSKVKKGQVIGYVGSTGRSTGPHLHYELRYKGKRKNPLTWRLPKQKRVAKSDLKRFQKRAKFILRRL